MTQMQVDEFDFSGSQGAAIAEASNKGGDFAREIEFLTLKADAASKQAGKDTAIIRLVTEYEMKPWMLEGPRTPYNFAWITVAQHYAQTKQKPPYAKEESQWPAKAYAVCRKDKVFAKKFGGGCYICDSIQNKASERTWALAVEREQVIENGTIIGFRDKTREVFDFDAEGKPIIERMDGDKKIYKKKTVPAFVVLNFGWKNFFNALNGQASWHQTCLDRDFVVKRSGEGANDTNYSFVALDPIILPAENPWGLPAGTKYDLGLTVGQDQQTGRPISLSEVLYPQMPDLRRIIAERTTDDYFGRWFIPGWLPKDFDPSKVQGQGQQQTGGYQPTGGYIAPTQGVQQNGGYVPPAQAQPQQPTAAPEQPQPQTAAAEPSADALASLKNRVLQGGGAAQPEGQPSQ